MRRSLPWLLALTLSCDRPAVAEPQPAAPAPKPDVVAVSDAAQPTLQKTERRLMGTVWVITLVGDDAAKARAAANRAFDEVDRLEQSLSEWRPDSDISHVNQQAGIAPVKVAPELIACVRASLDVARWSNGAFDISWAALRGLWDFSAGSSHVPPSKARVKAMLPLWNYKNIVLDEANGSVFLKKKGMQIGLGGVAKGYALDRAGESLIEAGFPNFLIYAGGQVLVHGKKGDRKWRVGIQHPREPRHFAFVEIEDGSLATSGDYEHSYEHQGVTYHHIIDPKTGFPNRNTSSVTLLAKTALWADAIDTAVFILGPKRGLEMLERAPGGPFEAAVVDPNMHLSLSPHMREQLVMTAEIAADGSIGAPRAP
ncbi:MAG TPA: FAD:protein FMN transferase [Polyangiales bacterium]|nr:FAD:protein FMN transferase [Polyangiales bacterium]